MFHPRRSDPADVGCTLNFGTGPVDQARRAPRLRWDRPPSRRTRCHGESGTRPEWPRMDEPAPSTKNCGVLFLMLCDNRIRLRPPTVDQAIIFDARTGKCGSSYASAQTEAGPADNTARPLAVAGATIYTECTLTETDQLVQKLTYDIGCDVQHGTPSRGRVYHYVLIFI